MTRTFTTALALVCTPLLVTACGSSKTTPAPTVGHAYMVNIPNKSIYNYNIGSDGSLNLNTTQILPFASYSFAIAVDPVNPQIFVTDTTRGFIYAYAITSGGVLSSIPLITNTMPTGSSPVAIAVDSSAQYAYVANAVSGSNSINEYLVGSTGVLSPVDNSNYLVSVNTLSLGSATPNAIVTDPRGQYVYVLTNNNTITTYQIGTNGALTATGSSTSIEGASSLTIDPNGQYMYVAASAGVYEYAIATSGALSSAIGSAAQTGTAPFAIGVDPTDENVYVTNSTSGTTAHFTIGSGGVLTAQTAISMPVLALPAMAISGHL